MKILILLNLLLLPLSSRASLFDSADILPKNASAMGAFGELILNDPSSEGIEARARYGLSEEWNLGAILGTGGTNKQMRLGAEAVYNILPDWEGQIGLSIVGSTIYLRRSGTGGMQFRLVPMGHKKVSAWNGLPAVIYLGVPFHLEGRGSTFHSGSQLVFGSIMDMNSGGRFYLGAEAGLKLARSESYVLLGAGYRLGEMRFEKRRKSNSRGQQNEEEYRDEDFR